MKRLALIVILSMAASAAFSETRRPERNIRQVAEPAGRRQAAVRINRPVVPGKGSDARQATAPPAQAPGVVQTNLFDASHIVWFVTTERLSPGTVITPYIVLPDDQQIELQGMRLTEAVRAGWSYSLPSIRNFSEFWPDGLLTFVVVVNANGSESQSAADFPIGVKRGYESVNNMVPRIDSATQGLDGKDVIVTIRGKFTTDRVYVLFEDVVVPQDAIRTGENEITVNMSRVPGLDLLGLQESLLTVGQSAWADTYIFRFVPPAAGSYNLPPQ